LNIKLRLLIHAPTPFGLTFSPGFR
jgi:hypothetical protein